jgi:NAD(P)-dependent dehydrogenase (short-subunit alcohol dehydrogenase family)
MPRRFEGKTVFITGGSTGIGAAVGVQFAREGARVVVAARHEDTLAVAVKAVEAEGAQGLAVQCDVTNRASIDAAVARAVDQFGGLDVVVANAGFGVNGPLAKLTTTDYRRQFDTNVFGVIDTVYATLPHLVASKGRLGIVSSVLGRIARPNMSAYCASKYALCGFSEAIAYELADRGVSVTCINPGMVASNFRRVDNQNTLHEDWSEVAPARLVVPADRAAREIVDALHRRKMDATITGHGRIGVFVYRHFPWLVRIGIRQATRGRLERSDRSRR